MKDVFSDRGFSSNDCSHDGSHDYYLDSSIAYPRKKHLLNKILPMPVTAGCLAYDCE